METKNQQPLDVLKELKKLRLGQENLEKELLAEFTNKKWGFFSETKEFLDLFRKDHHDLQQEGSKTAAKIDKIQGSISYFISTAEDAKDPRNRNVSCVIQNVKKAMEDVETFISAFKESQSSQFSNLASDEKSLESDVLSFNKKLELWGRNLPDEERKPVKVPNAIDQNSIKDMPPEVAQFQRFVDENGGNNGGWDAEDQTVFLKHWTTSKDEGDLIITYTDLLPTKEEADILEHISWYRQYLELLSLKKQAIARWKEEKETQLQRNLETARQKEEELAASYERQREMAEEQAKNERMERIQRLNAWKVERELQRLQKEETARKRETELTIRAEREREKQLEAKEKVQQLRSEILRKEQMEKRLAKEKKVREEMERKLKVEASRPRVELRNAIMVEEKQLRERQREMEKVVRKARIQSAAERLKPRVERDPNRVLKPTKGWQQRVRSAEPSTNRNVPPNFAVIPHRAVPTWRQGPV